MEAIYKNIRALRQALRLTQGELAKKTGYSDKSMIARIENGKVDLPLSKVDAFAKALHVAPSDLMGWEEDSPRAPKEAELVSYFRQFNHEGQGKVLDYVTDLAASGRYIKNNQPRMVEEYA